MKSELFPTMNDPFLILLGKAIENLGYRSDGIFILLAEGKNHVVEKISEGEYLLSTDIYDQFSIENSVFWEDLSVTVSSNNLGPFNKAVALLWFAVDFLCKNDSHQNPMRRMMFWMDVRKAIKKSNNKVAMNILMEMFQVYNTEKPALCS